MTTTLAIANQKGGVAKTTTVASVGAALAELGHSVLLVDLDPQACLTFSLGIDPEDLELSVHHVLTKGLDPAEAILETDDGVDLMPATIELARAEADLLTRTGREHVIKTMIETLEEDGTDYDWVLLDCPPSLGVLTVAALTAADGVLIPLQCETLSHRGVGQLLDTVHDVRRFTNRKLEVWGVLPTLYDGRTNHSRTVLETISDTYDLEVVEPPIPKTIKFAEAPAAGRSILATSRSSKGAQAYREVAANLVVRSQRPKKRKKSAPKKAHEVSAHRGAPVRPRYGRLAAVGASLAVTVIAVLGGTGALSSASGGPSSHHDAPAAASIGTAAEETTAQPRRTARRTARRPPRRPPGPRRPTAPRRRPTRSATPRCPPTPATAGGSSSARAASGSGWSPRARRCSAPTWSPAASPTTSTPAPTPSTRAPSRPGASTTPGR